jgi:hypothetical protein
MFPSLALQALANKEARSMIDASPDHGLELEGPNLFRLGAFPALGGLEFHPLPLLQ